MWGVNYSTLTNYHLFYFIGINKGTLKGVYKGKEIKIGLFGEKSLYVELEKRREERKS